MKRLLIVSVFLLIGCSFAIPMPPDGFGKVAVFPHYSSGNPPRPEVVAYTFVQGPDTLHTNYYDYMIGGYNNLALRTVADIHGGGYFAAFHARSTRAGTRRVFWVFISANGDLSALSEITGTNIKEGYPALALDTVSGKPLYAWHANCDDDSESEVMFAYDRMLNGIPGDITAPVPIIDNPLTVLTTDDNEFLWPEIAIGPSPNSGMRRVYVAAKNLSGHSIDNNPSGNVILAYADISADLLEAGNELVWNYTTVPLLDAWNHDPVITRRPFLALSTDDIGNVYLIGNHYAHDADYQIMEEEDLDLFVCSNFAEGSWTYHSFYSDLSCWNPVFDPFWPDGYFVDEEGNPYQDQELIFDINNSGHFNAVLDQRGRIHAIGLWALSTTIDNNYFKQLQSVKSYCFNPAEDSLIVRDIYPKGHPENEAYPHFIPWDNQPPWGEVDSWEIIDGEASPVMQTIFPFPHWDETLSNDAMLFHYNHLKLSHVNSENMMVAVWQDCQRARQANLYPDQYPENLAYANSPEIVIVASADGGNSWSDPIYLNNVDNPELAGINPIWVYPADKVKYMGMQGSQKIGRLGLLFLDDNSWGAPAIWNPHVMPDSCMVMFTELEIVFPEPVANSDPVNQTPALSGIRRAYPNPFRDQLNISLEIKASLQDYSLKIHNIKGQCVYKTSGKSKGDFELCWNGRDRKGHKLPAGIYLLSFSSGGKQSTRKVILY